MPKISQYPQVSSMGDSDYFLIDTTPITPDSTSIITKGNAFVDAIRSANFKGVWTQATSYKIDDIVQWQGGSFRCLTSNVSGTGGTGANANFETDFYVNGYWQQLSARQQWYDVRDYGAKLDNSDDTTAIQLAVDTAAAAGGGTVFIPACICAATQIVLKERVYLTGASLYSTTIRQISGQSQPLIINFVSPNGVLANAEFCGVLSLRIDGNRAGTSHTTGSGNTSTSCHGIQLNTNPQFTQATNDTTFDTHQIVDNVYIIHCAGQGFKADGRGETKVTRLYVEDCVTGGIEASGDTQLTSCGAGNNGVFGFYFHHGNIQAANCKAFITGRNFNTNVPGFLVSGLNIGISMAGCIAQNNFAQGFLIQNATGVIMSGCVADSNNYGTGNTSSQYAGVELSNVMNCIIDFVSQQGFQVGVQIGNQASALRINNGSDKNDIRTVTYGAPGFTLGPTVTSDSTLLTNRIVANGVILNPTQTLASLSDVSIISPTDGQGLQYSGSLSKWTNSTIAGNSFALGLLGDGSDGTVTLDGTVTPSWAVKSGNTYSLNRDVLAVSLTINSGVTLVSSGYRVFAQGTITNNGTMNADGNSATSATGASPSTSRSLVTGTKGGNGNTGAGSAGNAATGGFSVGVGGTGGAGSSAGGAGGAISNTLTWMLRSAQGFATGSVAFAGTVLPLTGGSGGGGGGGDGTNSGGGAGTGGSILCVFTRSFVNTGALSAVGGGGFTPVVGNCGGGAGGGGGLIIVFSINAWTQSGTTTVTGGAGGSGGGTGTAGANGSAGTVLNVVLQ